MKRFTFLVSILVILSTILPVQAAVVFNYHGDSITKAKYAAGIGDMVRLNSASALTLTTSAAAFGGKYLDMTSAPIVSWSGQDNAFVGVTQFTWGASLIPVASGAPAAFQGIFEIGNNMSASNTFGGMAIGITTAGKLQLTMASASGTQYANGAVCSAAFTFAGGQRTSIYLTWAGLSSGAAQVWQDQAGGVASLVGTITMTANMVAASRAAMGNFSTFDRVDNAGNSKFHIDEIFLDNTAIVPSALGIRSTYYYNGAAYEGYTQTALAAGSVHNGTIYGPGPGTLTGTDIGAAFNDAVSAGNLKHGVTINNLNASVTGTYAGADLFTAVSASDLKHGVVAAQNGSITGTYVGADIWTAVSAGSLKHGVVAAQNGSVTGTYTGSDLWTAAVGSNLVSGFSLLQNGSTITGTDVGAASNDALGASDLAFGLVRKNRGSNVTGTYRGYNLWTAIGMGNVASGFSTLQDGVTATGLLSTVTNTFIAPAISSRTGRATLQLR